jgi:hypothetical protein
MPNSTANILGIIDAILPDILVAIRAHRQASPTTWPTIEQVKAACNFDAQAVVDQVNAWEQAHPLTPA